MADGERCIIAGVGPGVGMGLATRFARAGFFVHMLARSDGDFPEFVARLRAAGGDGDGTAVDLVDFAATRAAIERIIARHGPVDLLIYNASLWNGQPALGFDPNEFQRDLALNITAALVCTQAVAPSMIERGQGEVIWTGGGTALDPAIGTAAPSLTAGKSGMRGLAFAMAGELRPLGIRLQTVTINGTVAPGTPFDPAHIAEAFYQRYRAPRSDETIETVFNGGPA